MARIVGRLLAACLVLGVGCSGGDDDTSNNTNTNQNDNTNLCEQGTISGTVRLEGRTDHSGVTVTLSGSSQSQITEADGAYSFEGVPSGIYTVQAQATGYAGTSSGAVVVQAPSCEATVLPLQLAIGRGGLQGVVQREDTDEHGGILVTLQSTAYAVLTGPTGRYAFSGIPVGQYTVVAAEDPYQPATASDLSVEAGAVTAVPTLVLRYPPSDCGNGVLEAAEQCDGTHLGGATCETFGFTGGILDCQGCQYDTHRCATCGNGVVEATESCDDGNQVDDLTCSSDCEYFCGDGLYNPFLGEECDRGQDNGVSPSECLQDCTRTTCGDGYLGGPEGCDDGGNEAGDGCAADCVVESKWECAGSPSQCRCAAFGHGPSCDECVVYVSADASPVLATGRDWDHAFPTVQAGIDAAWNEGRPCDVWVAAGTYYIYERSPRDTVQLMSQVSVYGGFAGDEEERAERDPAAHVTVLSGYASATSSHRVFHVVTAEFTDGARLDGVTVTGGNATGSTDQEDLRGGGFWMNLADLTVAGCRIVDNVGQESAAAFASGQGAVRFERCLIESNQSVASPEVIRVEGGSATVTDSQLHQNSGGISMEDSQLLVQGSEFRDQPTGVATTATVTEVTDSTFLRCGDALQLGLDLSNTTQSVVERVRILSGDYGIHVASGGLVLRDSVVAANYYGVTSVPPLEVTHTQFSGNLYGELMLGGNGSGGSYVVTDSVITGNRYQAGLSAFLTDTAVPPVPITVSVQGCVIAGNGGNGGVNVVVVPGAEPVTVNLSHNTIAGNHSDSATAAPGLTYNVPDPTGHPVWAAGSEVTVANNIIWGNESAGASEILFDDFDLEHTLDYCHVGELSAGDPLLHNVVGDPGFIAGPGDPADEGTWASVDPDPDTGLTWLAVAGSPWQPDALVGQFVQPDVRDPRWLPVVANTADAVAVWGDATVVFEDLGDFGPGSTYRIFDLRLDASSTCIDAALGCDQAGGCSVPWTVPMTPAEDVLGMARYNAGQSTANGGAGTPDYADRGAYEWHPPVP